MKKVLLATRRRYLGVFGYLPIVFLFLLMSACFASSLLADQNNVSKPSKEEVIQKTQKLQMPFIANDGQTDERVKFYANTFGGTVFVTRDGEIVYALPEGNEKANTPEMLNTDCGDFGFNPFFSKEKYLNTLLNKEGCINSVLSGTLAACGDPWRVQVCNLNPGVYLDNGAVFNQWRNQPYKTWGSNCKFEPAMEGCSSLLLNDF